MQGQVALRVSLKYSNPIVGVRFTPTVALRGAPDSYLKFEWYRLLNDKKVNCHVHKLEKAILQCRTCVRLNRPIEHSYHCSSECYYQTWESHQERHYVNLENTSDVNQDRENYGYDLENHSIGDGSVIAADRDGKLWLKVGFSRTYVPSSDDFGCILRLKIQVVDSQLVFLREKFTVTDRVIVLPPTHPRTMIEIETLVGYDSEAVRRRIRVLSYNILADMHAPQGKYKNCPAWSLNWAYRRENLLREIIAYKADIVCLQEVQLDHFENFIRPNIGQHGYSVTYKGREPKIFTRDGYKEYGCATFYRTDKFRKVDEHMLEFGRLAQEQLDTMQPNQRETGRRRLVKDNIAILTILEPVDALDWLNFMFCVVNTHICANENFKDVKLWQAATLVKEIERIVGAIPVLLCADLNSRPGSAPYDLIVHGYVDHNHLKFPGDPIGIFDRIELFHNLPLVSAYSESDATLDYIFYRDDKLRLKSHLELPQLNNPLPSPQWSSDHIALMADFEFA